MTTLKNLQKKLKKVSNILQKKTEARKEMLLTLYSAEIEKQNITICIHSDNSQNVGSF